MQVDAACLEDSLFQNLAYSQWSHHSRRCMRGVPKLLRCSSFQAGLVIDFPSSGHHSLIRVLSLVIEHLFTDCLPAIHVAVSVSTDRPVPKDCCYPGVALSCPISNGPFTLKTSKQIRTAFMLVHFRALATQHFSHWLTREPSSRRCSPGCSRHHHFRPRPKSLLDGTNLPDVRNMTHKSIKAWIRTTFGSGA